MADTRDQPFYDQDGVFERYSEHRSGQSWLSPNRVMEEPAVLAEIGDPAGLRILDLGCGDGAFGRDLLAAGARSYVGYDNSRRMVEAARVTLAGTAGDARLAEIDDLIPEPGTCDLVTARLSLHYVADLGPVISRAADALVPGGRLIITVVHPVITSHDNPGAGPRTSWTVDDYFAAGPRPRSWMGAEVTWHHRTVEHYIDAFLDAGLDVTAVRECEPRLDRFHDHLEEFERRRRVPLFLLLHGQKAAEPQTDARHIVDTISAVIPVDRRAFAAIDGVGASGKTTLATTLASQDWGRPVVLIHVDDFFNPTDVRHARGRLSPEGFWLDAFNYSALVSDVLEPLRDRPDGRHRPAAYDRATGQMATPDFRWAAADAVVLVEGTFLLRDELAPWWDFSIFLDITLAESTARMTVRDHLTDEQASRYAGAQLLYFTSARPWERADLVLAGRAWRGKLRSSPRPTLSGAPSVRPRRTEPESPRPGSP